MLALPDAGCKKRNYFGNQLFNFELMPQKRISNPDYEL